MGFSSAFEGVDDSIGLFFCLVPPWVVPSAASSTEGRGFIYDAPFPSTGIVTGELGSMLLLSVRRTVWWGDGVGGIVVGDGIGGCG